ncbi:hypothetical protein DACRYDRAFT_105900 [Dacryopinax primogenitus]|uniref:Nitrogen regulatory protein areA GATA-like domain-containing protein n=1 Tax=Dacryopinax primogenitus (strain DJM 731) TaxID=1858805 RepID=M5GF14_DACPD|nr:uncharacterized protein DACRYDRAFT_105900 [Dacryopinax primogenitus]EJU03743.1 hypothetical protein DACRYDRAFT_105900 [Dacryopinax primogenitus]
MAPRFHPSVSSYRMTHTFSPAPPSICVDYLSHNWEEQDVWVSWRNMTRHKNDIANGARLENACWRTWWKQRNHLQTCAPEMLGWLKDGDVTWLYGPFHTAADPIPASKKATLSEKSMNKGAKPTKSILKRTVGDTFWTIASAHLRDAESGIHTPVSNTPKSAHSIPTTQSDSAATSSLQLIDDEGDSLGSAVRF